MEVVEEKGEGEKESKVLWVGWGGGVGEASKTSGDALRFIQGQPSVPRTSRLFRSMVFWDS